MTEIKSIYIRGRTDLRLADFSNSGVNRIVIPKEAKKIAVNSDPDLLGSVSEIEFEDPTGWGVKNSIISDPKKMCAYVKKGCDLKKNDGFGSIFKKLFGG